MRPKALFTTTPVIVEGSGDPHATIAVSAYFISNMLSAIHRHPQSGDWWWELQYKLREAHEAIGGPSLIDNENREWAFTDAEPGGMIFTVVRHHNGTEWVDGPPQLQPFPLTPEERVIVEEQQRIDAEPETP